MKLDAAINLIRSGLPNNGVARWADLGAGEGLFTIALSNLIAEGSIIYAVDSNAKALKKIEINPKIELIKMVGNFEKDELQIRGLDGILMANALHFVKNKTGFIKKAQSYLQPGGRFIIVEYDTDTPNRWVPYPISFTACQEFFSTLGYSVTKIGEQRSIYNNVGMYSASILPRG